MRKAALTALLAVPGHRASAERPSTLELSCAQAAALITERGAIVLGTGGYTYRRFVAHRGYCAGDEQTEPAWRRQPRAGAASARSASTAAS
jgi:hypothetical protein